MSKFENGNSFGRGRRRGSRNKATLIREAISQADSVGVVRAMVRKARGGDVPAASLVLPYICPAETYVKISSSTPPRALPGPRPGSSPRQASRSSASRRPTGFPP